MKSRSIRLRLMVLAAATVAVTLSAAYGVLVLVFERHMEHRLALELENRWTELAAALTLDGDKPRLAYEPADPRYRHPLSGAYYAILDAGGPVVRSRSLWDSDIAREHVQAALAATEPVEYTGPDGVTLYLLAKPARIAVPGGEKVQTIAVALDHAEIDALADEFGRDVALALGVIAALLLLGTWVQIGLGLSPLAALRRELDRMRRGASSRMTGAFPEEVEPLVEDLNQLLDRQDDLIRRARERAGTLAHGLKTPLTIIQGEARRLERGGNEDVAETLREQVRAMNAHVERELSRARTHGQTVGAVQATDALTTVLRIVALEKRMPRGAELDWRVDIPRGLRVRMEADDFGEVVGNLLDNARKWARTRVAVLAWLEGGRAVFSVEDDGPGLPADLGADVVERGVRGSAAVEGSGLGLSIVREVLASYGGALSIPDGPGEECRIGFSVEGRLDPEPAPQGRPTWPAGPQAAEPFAPARPGVVLE
ncbi:sensor histidine kinase [Prosthecomicrobium sp. N25]|uniref:sensor histidine kinase n=1 Tax=Prosthecomicrobium sp. N25 TaxID=3129254 RepID=UPI003076EB97